MAPLDPGGIYMHYMVYCAKKPIERYAQSCNCRAIKKYGKEKGKHRKSTENSEKKESSFTAALFFVKNSKLFDLAAIALALMLIRLFNGSQAALYLVTLFQQIGITEVCSGSQIVSI